MAIVTLTSSFGQCKILMIIRAWKNPGLDIKDKGEYQITDALERMKNAGTVFAPGEVNEWLDCGNKNATVYTNQRVLEFIKSEQTIASSASIEDSTIIEPCYIGEGVILKNAIIGPHVSIGDNSEVRNSVISNSIIQTNTKLEGLNLTNSMIGNHTSMEKAAEEVSIGDYNEWKA